MAGIEPAAYSLEGCRATNCATWANLIIIINKFIYEQVLEF